MVASLLGMANQPLNWWIGFFAAAVGVTTTLLMYGILQERVMQRPYGGELFRTSLFVVFCNRVCCSVLALIGSKLQGGSMKNQAPLWKYALASFSNIAASFFQYESLRHVAFALQVLSKGCKLIPVMLWGVALGRSYKRSEWLLAGCLVLGMNVFIAGGDVLAPTTTNSLLGVGCLAAFLICDGFTSTFQERLFREHNTTKVNQMLYLNPCTLR
eukprot:NODE_22303_length_713_cov_4.428328.p1 GENE.NODE_22303_length_713_cov_4.428328~~NODE_22303_length_713_cov_4.428328.p1  ORF type:complete len:214 (-),score=56.33 NODE_22303_length_713_cov_4.428328:4-645(-)